MPDYHADLAASMNLHFGQQAIVKVTLLLPLIYLAPSQLPVAGANPGKPPATRASPAPVGAKPAASAANSVDSQCQKLLHSAADALANGMVGEARSFVEQAMQLTSAGDYQLQQASCYELLGKIQI